jgi:hypothetical protein
MRELGFAAVGLLLAGGCGTQAAPSSLVVPTDDGPGVQSAVCEPDRAARCVGPGNCQGGKLCGSDGTYGPCACDGDAGSVPDANFADGMPFDAGDSANAGDADAHEVGADGEGPELDSGGG